MVRKHLIYPQRIRKIPKHFSWLDHRLVSDHYIDHLSHPAANLYLFLVTASRHGWQHPGTDPTRPDSHRSYCLPKTPVSGTGIGYTG